MAYSKFKSYSKKEKYFMRRKNFFKDEIWHWENCVIDEDSTIDQINEQQEMIAKLKKRLEKNENKYWAYLKSDEYRKGF